TRLRRNQLRYSFQRLTRHEIAMSEPFFDRQRAALASLLRLVEDRRRSEPELAARLEDAEEEAREQSETQLKQVTDNRQKELARIDATFDQDQNQLTRRQQKQQQAEATSFDAGIRGLAAEEKEGRERLNAELKDALWTCDSVLETG